VLLGSPDTLPSSLGDSWQSMELMKEKVAAWSIFMATGLTSILFGFFVYFGFMLLVGIASCRFFPGFCKWFLRVSGIAVFPSFILAGIFLINVGNPNCSSLQPLSCLSLQTFWPLYGGINLVRSKWVLEGPFAYSVSASVFSILGTMVIGIAVGAWLGILELLAIPGIVLFSTVLYPLLIRARAWMIGKDVDLPALRTGQESKRYGGFEGFGRLFLWTVVLVLFSPLYFSQAPDFMTLLRYSLMSAPVFIASGWISEFVGLHFASRSSTRPIGPLIFSAIAGVFGLLTVLQILMGVPQSVANDYVDETFALYFACLGLSITVFFARPFLTRAARKLVTVGPGLSRTAIQASIIVVSLAYWLLLIINPQITAAWSSVTNSALLGVGLLLWLALSSVFARLYRRGRLTSQAESLGKSSP
jgi:hypothetical protein